MNGTAILMLVPNNPAPLIGIAPVIIRNQGTTLKIIPFRIGFSVGRSLWKTANNPPHNTAPIMKCMTQPKMRFLGTPIFSLTMVASILIGSNSGIAPVIFFIIMRSVKARVAAKPAKMPLNIFEMSNTIKFPFAKLCTLVS